MENGEWRMENGEWRMENGEWRMENVNPCQWELAGNGDAGEQQHSRIVRSARRGLKPGGERCNPVAGSPQGETTEPPSGEEACRMAARRARSAGADAATGSERGKCGSGRNPALCAAGGRRAPHHSPFCIFHFFHPKWAMGAFPPCSPWSISIFPFKLSAILE